MALPFVLDEQLRGGPLWHAIQQHNRRGSHVLDVVRVGDLPTLPLGTRDPDLLLWCEAHGRILISEDKRSMPGHLTNHFLAGRHLPGVLLLTGGWKVVSVLARLVHYDQTLDLADFLDRTEYIA